MKKFIILSTICLMIYVAYKAQQIDIPEGFSQPGLLRFFKLVMKTTNEVIHLFTLAGITSFHDGKRFTFDVLASMDNILDGNKQYIDTRWDDTRVRIYSSDKIKENGPALIFLHGGGWVAGSSKSHNPVVKKLFNELQIFTVSIDYKMAPEHKYPGPDNDCEAAIVYLMKNAKKFKIDPTKIIVGGDSAGGHLSIQMAHRFINRHDKLPSIRAIFPVYPVTQPYYLFGPSYKVNKDDYMLPAENMNKYWSLYITGSVEWEEVFTKNQQTKCSFLKELEESKVLDYNFSSEFDYKEEIPKDEENKKCNYNKEFWEKYGNLFNDDKFSILLKNFKDMPPTFLVTMQYDVLRDDGLLLLKLLQKNRVEVEHYHDPRGFHTLINGIDYSDENKKLIASIVEFIKKHS